MSDQAFWVAKARRLAWARNFAVWLELFLPTSAAVAAIGAIALLVFRVRMLAVVPVYIAIGIACFSSALMTLWLSRRRFFSTGDALTRLDVIGHLHNRLTAAAAGLGNWPKPVELKHDARWNWARLLAPIAFSIAVLTAAAWVKVPERSVARTVVESPLAWGEINSWLQTLEQSQLIQPEPLQNLRDQMEALSQQPAENWYSQNSLEASDTLRQQTEQALKSMLRDMQTAQESLGAAAMEGQALTPGEMKAANESLQKSLQGLEMGNLPLKKELLENFKKIDVSKLKQMNASQLAEMQKQLKAGIRVCQKCLGPSVRPGKVIAAESGGEGSGGKPAPLTLKQAQTDLRTKETEAISNEDLSRATIGDVTGVDRGTHEVKKNAPKMPVSGGSISSAGNGGEAVWRDSLTPEEQEVLQRFFK